MTRSDQTDLVEETVASIRQALICAPAIRMSKYNNLSGNHYECFQEVKIPINSGLIFLFAGSVLVSRPDQLLL